MVATRYLNKSVGYCGSQDRTMDLCRSLKCPRKTSDRIWYRLKTAPGAEKALCQKLLLRNVPCYYPKVRVKSKSEFGSELMFPGYVFAALTENDTKDVSREFLVEDTVKYLSDTHTDLIDSELNFMVFAERLNCFYPFRQVETCPTCPAGVNGIDYVEICDKDSGYILAIPQKRNSNQNVYFRFDSIPANIEFTLPQPFFVEILNLK